MEGICMTSHRLDHFKQCSAHFSRLCAHADAGVFEGCDLRRRRALATADDGTGMAHTASGRGGGSRDEPCHRFLAILFYPLSSFLLSRAANFTDHDDALRLRVVIEELDDVQMRSAAAGIAADADPGGLATTAD